MTVKSDVPIAPAQSLKTHQPIDIARCSAVGSSSTLSQTGNDAARRFLFIVAKLARA
jgi:hypothetical protein